MINYSDDLSFFILTNLQKQRTQFLSFLSHSYDGGNDENNLFNFIFSKLPTLPKYQQFANAFKGADLLIVSDFMWGGIFKENMDLIKAVRDGGMMFYGLGIGVREYDLDSCNHNNAFDDNEYDYVNGYKFLKDCDFRYLYNQGEIIEYLERPKIL